MNTEEKKQSRLTKKQKRNIIIVIIVLVVMVLADFVWSNTYIEVKKLSAHFDNLPEGFEGCKIVQISDFHNEWGKGYIDRLTEKVKDCEPDYIFVTGDSVDQIFPDVDRSLELMKSFLTYVLSILLWATMNIIFLRRKGNSLLQAVKAMV